MIRNIIMLLIVFSPVICVLFLVLIKSIQDNSSKEDIDGNPTITFKDFL